MKLCVFVLLQAYLVSLHSCPTRAVIRSPASARLLCSLSYLILITSWEAAEPDVFQMRKVRLNPSFANLAAHHSHLWELCKLQFGVPGGGDTPCFLKSSQSDPGVQPDLGTQGLSYLPRVLRKVGKHTQAITVFFRSSHLPIYWTFTLWQGFC